MNNQATTIVVGIIIGVFVILMTFMLGYDAGKSHGRAFERADIMATPITVGNPSNPDCSVEITIGTLADMAAIGIYGWADACEEVTQ